MSGSAEQPGERLADTLGRRRTIVGSLGFGAGTMVLLSQAQVLEAILAIAFLNGRELYRPASRAWLTDPEPARLP